MRSLPLDARGTPRDAGACAPCGLARSTCHLPPPATPWRCVHASCYTNFSLSVPAGSVVDARGPALLLFVHISKTGGTSIMTWLDRLVRPPARLTASFRYGRPSCLFGLFPERFPRDQWKPRCGSAERPDWRTSRFAFEFHTWSSGIFLRRVVPQLEWLRSQYAERGGNIVVCTLLREPISHLLSYYTHLPPTDAATRRVLPLTIDRVRGARRMQQRALTGRPEFRGKSWTPRKERDCSVDLAASRAVLHWFDVVSLARPRLRTARTVARRTEPLLGCD